MKMEIKDIIGKKVAIWCDTEEKSILFLEKASRYKECLVTEETKLDSYESYGNVLCYRIKENGKVIYASKNFYSDYEIISYNDFFGISEQVESETLTAVEVLEWFGKNYYNDAMCEKVLGTDADIVDMLEELGAEEVIKRITSYELEQRKAKVSDEEIALLLDEKYGVGKWVRKNV